ncbi:MAG: transglycosylase domain-containing protein, partial [Microbacterium sp.]
MPENRRTLGGALSALLGLVGLSAVAGVLVTLSVTPAIAAGSFATTSAVSMFDSLPSYLAVDTPMLPTTIYATDENGNDFELTSYYDQNRIPVEYDDVPDVMYDALLSSEDSRYFEHGGIDLVGTIRAILNNLQGSSTQGGSSISQQYVKNVLIERCEQTAADEDAQQQCYSDATETDGAAGIERKLQEMRYAVAIEQQYSKEQILIGYLNLVNFGGTTYGIEAAAERYFDTTVGDLTLNQAATLAGMVQNPNAYRIDMPSGSYTQADGTVVNSEDDGYSLTLERRNSVLDRMLALGKITQDEHDEVTAEPIEPSITSPKTGCSAAGGSAYFCKYVEQSLLHDDRYASIFGDDEDARWEAIRRGGYSIHTTLDFRLQQPAEAAMTTYAPSAIDGMDFGATEVSVEPSTGRILALAQNTTFDESDDAGVGETGLVYAADSAHGSAAGTQVGSTYKLFTLVDWLENGHSINEQLNGVSRTFTSYTCNGQTESNSTKIGNFDNESGYVGSVLDFTRDSLNSGFLAMATQLDIGDINSVAKRFGVTLGNGGDVTDECNLYDVLGSKSIAPLAMASAYATIANDGIRCEPHAIDSIVDADGNEVTLPDVACERVVESNIAATVATALKAPMGTGGTGAAANPGDGTDLIGKTGTHESIQTMMIESSTTATTTVWVGNVQGDTDLFTTYANGYQMSQVRYLIAKDVQTA